MEVDGAAQNGAPPTVFEEEITQTRNALRRLREAMVKRNMQRATEHADGWTPDLRLHPDQFPPLQDNKMQWEIQVARMIVSFLLKPTTSLPVDVDTMHRRLLQSQMGAEYEHCLAAMGFPSGPHPLIARLCRDQLLEALQLQIGPKGGGLPRRIFIVQIDRAGLAGLVGIEDTMGMAAMLQQQQQAQQMGGMMGLPGIMAPPGVMMGPGGMLPGGMPIRPPPVPPNMPGQPPGFMQGQMQSIMPGPPPGMPPGPDGMPGIMPLGGPGGMQDMGGMHGPGGMGQGHGQHGGGDGGGGKRPPDTDLDSLLSRKTQRDRLNLDRGNAAELQAVLAKPTAREAAQLDAFRSAAGQSAIQEHCQHLTKEECRRANKSHMACPRLHFRRLIFPHTDLSLGNCSYLNTCRNFRNCKYVHYEVDEQQDDMMGMQGGHGMHGHMMAPGMMQQGPPPAAKQANSVPKYLQALIEPQWIQCDIRTLDMKVLGKFGVIMADPPWQIHQDLPYGTMEDDEMRRMDIGTLQDDGVIFLWVTGRAMELGRECLKIWGYDRVDELIWVKTNQLNRLIRTGRTGHWINHSKEHCLVGYKGKPALNKYVDCDVVVAEVRETSRKPDEMYPLLERLSPGTRKLEIFARAHNLAPGWVGLGNQLNGVQILDPDMKARYIARYGPPGPDGKLPKAM